MPAPTLPQMTAQGVMAALLSLALSACGPKDLDTQVRAYREQQVRDLRAQYERASGQRDLLAMCVKSNQVAGAYADAQDSADASAWRSKSTADCQTARQALAAGQPRSPGSAR